MSSPPPVPKKKFWILDSARKRFGVAIVFVAAAAAFLSNPGQDYHLKEIREVVVERQLTNEESYGILRLSSYENYYLFSLVTFGKEGSVIGHHVLSYGVFGVVKTTGEISEAALAIQEVVRKTQTDANE